MLLNIYFSFDFYRDLIEEAIDCVLREEEKLAVREDVRVLTTEQLFSRVEKIAAAWNKYWFLADLTIVWTSAHVISSVVTGDSLARWKQMSVTQVVAHR